MYTKKTDSFVLIRPELKKSSEKEEKKISFFNDFSENYSTFKDDNLIVDFSEDQRTDLKEILLFSQLNRDHKANGRSFVIVCKHTDLDKLPEEMIVVPTLEEAKDVIVMEDIERDLGF